jgi:predicted RecA/RadA family phage recombinase
MAKNMVFERGTKFSAVCSQPASPKSGDPVLIGQIPAVATTDERADGTTSVDTEGIWELAVEGKDAANANTAVNVGDVLYYDAANTVKLNKDNTNGVRFGYALAAVSSGATATIRVKVGY